MSSANGRGTRWNPGGSRQPLASTFSAWQRGQLVRPSHGRGVAGDPGGRLPGGATLAISSIEMHAPAAALRKIWDWRCGG